MYVVLGLKVDAIIIIFQFIFSFFSGYLVVLSYEFTAAEFESADDRNYGSKLLTQSFQLGCFSAVLCSSIVVIAQISAK